MIDEMVKMLSCFKNIMWATKVCQNLVKNECLCLSITWFKGLNQFLFTLSWRYWVVACGHLRDKERGFEKRHWDGLSGVPSLSAHARVSCCPWCIGGVSCAWWPDVALDSHQNAKFIKLWPRLCREQRPAHLILFTMELFCVFSIFWKLLIFKGKTFSQNRFRLNLQIRVPDTLAKEAFTTCMLQSFYALSPE